MTRKRGKKKETKGGESATKKRNRIERASEKKSKRRKLGREKER